MSEKQLIFYYLETFDIAMCVTFESDIIVGRMWSDLSECRAFEMFKGYSHTSEGLIRFKADMIEMNEDLLKYKVLPRERTEKEKDNKIFLNKISFDYLSYKNHSDAIREKFHKSTLVNGKGKQKLLTTDLNRVDSQEFYFHKGASASGLMVLNDKFKDKYKECYGYDYSKFYSHLMSDKGFRFPIGPGVAKRIKTINYEALQFGIYQVIVESTDPRFLSMFKFSEDDYYCSDMLTYLYKIKDTYNIKFGLVKTDKGVPNVYLYDDENINTGYEHFYIWFYQLNQLNTLLDNDKRKMGLLKNMMSGLWGRLVSFKRERLSWEDCEGLDISFEDDEEETEYKILDATGDLNSVINTGDAYKFKYGRMKPFLCMYGRLKMLQLGHMIQSTTNCEIIRIHTDGIVLDKPYKMSLSRNLWDISIHGPYYPGKDEKISGELKFKNVLYQYRRCSKCHEDFKIMGNCLITCQTCSNTLKDIEE
jgi:hypothetical protein